MKSIKLLVLSFCLLLGSYSVFAQTKVEQLNKEIELCKQKIKDAQTMEELDKHARELDSLKSQLQLIEFMVNEKANTTNKESKMREEYKKVQDGDKGYHEAMEQFMPQINAYEMQIQQQEDSIKFYKERQAEVRNKLRNNIARIANCETKEVPGFAMNLSSKDFVEKYSKQIKVKFSEAEAEKVQKTYNAAKEKYQELEKKKQKAENEKNKLTSALESLREQFKGCKGCPK